MILIISILLVYGITLLIVQGTIFDDCKIRLAKWINSLEDSKIVDKSKIIDMLERSDRQIDNDCVEMYFIMNERLAVADSPELIEELIKKQDELIEMVRQDLISPKFDFIKNILLFVLLKLQKVTSCMMCMGFWVGLGLCLLSLSIPLTLFGVSFVLISQTTFFGYGVSIFLLSCLLSGTTWMLNTAIEAIYDIKNNH